NLAFYYVPTAAEAPKYEVYFAESPHRSKHPTGTKGIGEAATIASTPAVIAAVEDAVRRIKPGVRINKTPVTPEFLWRLLR
ncbi:TPA: xanthine dehydrogenase family protein molybdopterin-binding subunit, partial [Pyrobaculum aerophilum]|nr:xanthine dehydrogenase family protein molybdopterin-binding subunit [Pyrobaculum aerophilum]